MNKYSENEVKRILNEDIGTTDVTETKIQEAYAQIRRAAKVREFQNVKETGTALRTRGWKHPGMRRGLVLAAAVGLLAVTSVTALAVNGFFTKKVTTENETLSYTFDVDYSMTPKEVEITPGYIPEGYTQMENGALKWCADENWRNGISLSAANANWLGVYGEALNMENVISMEETTIGGMEAHLITRDYDRERGEDFFDKRIYVFHPDEGFVGIVYGGNDMTMDELKKVAEGVTYTLGDEDAEKIEKDEQQDAADKAQQEEWIRQLEYGVPQENIYEIGETFNPDLLNAQRYLENNLQTEYYSGEKGVEVKVVSAEIVDSVQGLDESGFFLGKVQPRLNEDGTLAPYDRVVCSERDKYDGQERELSRDYGIQQKFLKVTLEATNLKEETEDFWAGGICAVHLIPSEGNYAYEGSYVEALNRQEYGISELQFPVYFDKSPYAGEQNGQFFFRELEPQETLTYTLLYIVDEDRLENLYLEFGQGYYTENLDEVGGKIGRWYVKVN